MFLSYLLNYLLTHVLNYLLTCFFFLNYLLVSYLLNYLLVLNYLLTCFFLTYLLTYLLTPWSRVLEKLTGSQPVMKFPTFYGSRRFITAFTSSPHVSLSWASSIQSIPPHTHPTSWRSILTLSSHLRLGLPRGLFHSGWPPKLCILLSPPPYALHAPFISLLDFITRTILGEGHRSLSSSLCSFLHYSVTSSLLGQNIILSTPFSNTNYNSINSFYVFCTTALKMTL